MPGFKDPPSENYQAINEDAVRRTIIKTRYRDIPYEEVLRSCATSIDNAKKREIWEIRRGKPVHLETPAISGRSAQLLQCGGPFYRLVEDPSKVVCPHVAEIGD